MVIVSTTGYFISVLGPYLADSKNSDSGILNHAVRNNIEEIKNWAQPNDIFVVDRGFRDSRQVLEEMGIKAQMPKFMPKGAKQLTTMDANHSRFVTKVYMIYHLPHYFLK
jgi:GTP-dependent phosphoenolpyruvate carboxykinase